MLETDETTNNGSSGVANEEQWPGIDSMYRLIIVAALRNKQLLRGARPRIEADPLKRKNVSIALEEVKQGLVPFTNTVEARKSRDDNNQMKPDEL